MRLTSTRRLRLAALCIVLTAGGLLSGCGGDEEKAPAPATSAGGGAAAGGAEGTVEIGERVLTFTTDVCMADGEGALVSGPGQDAGGTPVYVDLDSTASDSGEIRIDLGTDQKFSSSDEALRGGDMTGDFALEMDGDDIRVTAGFIEEDGSDLGPGTLAVTCA